MMTLADYLRDTETPQRDFAARLGVSEGTVSRWISRVRIPRPEHIRAIAEATEGRVAAASWFAADPASAASPPSVACATTDRASSSGEAA